jgi:thiol-disulfide isomerase/thioredoxin
MANKKIVWIIMGIIFVIGLAFFYISSNGEISLINEFSESGNVQATSEGRESNEMPFWMTAELTDVNTRATYTISSFRGRPVLLESFAVWCPTCTRQQRVLKELHEEVGDEIVSISLDTDPNEDEEKVRNHAKSNNFNWFYSVSPTEVTQSFIDDFGASFVSAPSVPMVLICEDLSYRKLSGFGVRSVEKLKTEVARGCN